MIQEKFMHLKDTK